MLPIFINGSHEFIVHSEMLILLKLYILVILGQFYMKFVFVVSRDFDK